MSHSKPIFPEDWNYLGVSGRPTIYSRFWGVLYGVEVEVKHPENIDRCSFCFTQKIVKNMCYNQDRILVENGPFVMPLPTILRINGHPYTLLLPVVLCNHCSNILSEKWYDNPERHYFDEKDSFMGQGDDYWQILDFMRQRFGINPYPLLIPKITALERLGLDSDLVREMFAERS